MQLAPDKLKQQTGDCLLFATADWDTPYWTNKQHTADHLVKAGWRVLYVESIGLRAPKLGSGTDWGRIARRLWRGIQGPRQMRDGLWVLSPLLIPFKHNHAWVRAINQGLLSWTISRFLGQHSFRAPLVWTYHPYLLEVLDDLNNRYGRVTGPLVYHCVDDLSAIPGIDANAFNTEERRLLARADAAFTTSRSLHEKCSRHSNRVHDFPNVVDVSHFSRAHDPGSAPEDIAQIPTPRIGYVGALSDFKVDFELLHDLARDNPQWSFVVIGEEREGQNDPTLRSMSMLPNVHLLGHKPYEALPDYLRALSVALLPTRINAYTKSMFPMKYYEYVAAGLPVISTPLEFTRTLAHPVATAATHQEFTLAISKALQTGKLTKPEGLKIIGPNTWTHRLQSMLNIVTKHRHS